MGQSCTKCCRACCAPFGAAILTLAAIISFISLFVPFYYTHDQGHVAMTFHYFKELPGFLLGPIIVAFLQFATMFLISVPALCNDKKIKVTAEDIRRRERERQRALRAAAAEHKKAEAELAAVMATPTPVPAAKKAKAAVAAADAPDTEPSEEPVDIEEGKQAIAADAAAASIKQEKLRRKREVERLAREHQQLEETHDKERQDDDRMLSKNQRTNRSDDEPENEFADEFPTFRETKQVPCCNNTSTVPECSPCCFWNIFQCVLSFFFLLFFSFSVAAAKYELDGDGAPMTYGPGFVAAMFAHLISAFATWWITMPYKAPCTKNVPLAYNRNTRAAVVIWGLFSIMLFAFIMYVAVTVTYTCPGLRLDIFTFQDANFDISTWATGLAGVRALTTGKYGYVIGGSSGNQVYAIIPPKVVIHDSLSVYDTIHYDMVVGEGVYTIFSGLNAPAGVAYSNKTQMLYVAQSHKITAYDWDTKIQPLFANGASNPAPSAVIALLPNTTVHAFRNILVGPDNYLYVSIGAPCNICDQLDPFNTIMRVSLNDTSKGLEVYARGVRDSIGMAFHPVTGQLWFTDTAREWQSDDFPPDELNIVTSSGQHFGYPYCTGNNIADPDANPNGMRSCNATIVPYVSLPAHIGAAGIRFYSGSMFPAKYTNTLIIAEHGNWDRATLQGYRLSSISIDDTTGLPVYASFAASFLDTHNAPCGAPVDVEVWTDGSLLIADDTNGAIHRIRYG